MGYTKAPRLTPSGAERRRKADEADMPPVTGVKEDEDDEEDEGVLDAEDTIIASKPKATKFIDDNGAKSAVATAEVARVCEGDLVCERLSNVENSLTGASFNDIQELLDGLNVAPGREGIWR